RWRSSPHPQRSCPPPPPRQARATVPEGGVPGPRPSRRQWFEEVVWGAVGRVSATRMSPKSPHGRVHGVPDEGPPHRLHRGSPPQRPRARHATDTETLTRSAGKTPRHRKRRRTARKASGATRQANRPPGNAPQQAPANHKEGGDATREPGTIRAHPRKSAQIRANPRQKRTGPPKRPRPEAMRWQGQGRRASSAATSAFALGIRSFLVTPSNSRNGQATRIDDSVPITMPIICDTAIPSSDEPPYR